MLRLQALTVQEGCVEHSHPIVPRMYDPAVRRQRATQNLKTPSQYNA